MTKQLPIYNGVQMADSANTASAVVLRDTDASINVGQVNAAGLALSSGNLVLPSETLGSSVSIGNVIVHKISGAFTFTLPAAAASTGQTHIIKKTDNTTASVVDANASETIDGAASKSSTVQYSSLVLWCDGTSWHVIGSTGTWT